MGNFVPPVVRRKAIIPLESDVEKRFIKKIQRAGGVTWKFVSPNNRGVSDRIVLFFGRVIFVEMKREGKDLTDKQKLFRQRVLDHGGEFATVCGDDGADEFIDRIKADRGWFAQGISFLFALGTRITEKYGK